VLTRFRFSLWLLFIPPKVTRIRSGRRPTLKRTLFRGWDASHACKVTGMHYPFPWISCNFCIIKYPIAVELLHVTLWSMLLTIRFSSAFIDSKAFATENCISIYDNFGGVHMACVVRLDTLISGSHGKLAWDTIMHIIYPSAPYMYANCMQRVEHTV
jgi:hypothetical protein